MRSSCESDNVVLLIPHQTCQGDLLHFHTGECAGCYVMRETAHPELASALPAELLEWCLLYVLQANQELDVATIALRLQNNPELKQQTMSLAEKLVKQGEARGEHRGRQEGEARGLWTGKLELLQQLMGKPMCAEVELAKLSVAELQTQFEALEAEYRSVYKAL
jgi:predicted transposase YdaD